MKTQVVVFACLCALGLLATVVVHTEALKELIDFDFDIDVNRRFKKKLAKKLLYYFLLTGNKKIYAVPVPLPIPIPILKKLQPIIYKEGIPVPFPVHEPIHFGCGHGGCGGW